MQASLQILHLESVLPAVSVHLRSLIAADGCRTVDDPLPDEFRVMPHFEILQAVASVERPFADVADTLWQADTGKIRAFKEGAFIQRF